MCIVCKHPSSVSVKQDWLSKSLWKVWSASKIVQYSGTALPVIWMCYLEIKQNRREASKHVSISVPETDLEDNMAPANNQHAS